jgi:hypothetical protein
MEIQAPIKCFAFCPPSLWPASSLNSGDLRVGYVPLTEADKREREIELPEGSPGRHETCEVLSLYPRIFNLAAAEETIEQTTKELTVIARASQLTRDAQGRYPKLTSDTIEDEILGVYLEGSLVEFDVSAQLSPPAGPDSAPR